MPTGNRLGPLNGPRITRRNLPHWEYPGSTYFVTFRTAKGITLNDSAKDIVFACVRFFDGARYALHACAVMDTHVHLVIQPLEISEGSFHSTSRIMHSLKSYSSKKAAGILGRTGHMWLDENFDRVIRNEEEYFGTLDHILYNPVRAAFVERPEDYRWLVVRGAIDSK